MITHALALRNTIAQAVADAITVAAGSPTGFPQLIIRDGSTVVVTFNLEAVPFGAPVAGVIAAAGTPILALATGDGPSVDNFLITNGDGDTVLSGSVTATGMGGDIEVTNVNIATDQECELESLTYEAPQ